MPHVLVIANETVGGAALLAAVQKRIAADPATRFSLVVPQSKPKHGGVIYDDARRDAAQVRVDLAVAYMRNEGVEIHGQVGDPDAFIAALDGVDEHHPDAIIVSTLPESRSGWLRRDLPERIAESSGLPVEHVVSDLDAEGLIFCVTLVVANRTAGGEELHTHLKTIAEESHADEDKAPRLFIVVVPQDDGGGAATTAARARLGGLLHRLGRDGLLAAGMVGDPDPYIAIMNALSFFRVDEIVVSTLPETKSGWLRGDLIERVRKASHRPVEHIVAREAETASA